MALQGLRKDNRVSRTGKQGAPAHKTVFPIFIGVVVIIDCADGELSDRIRQWRSNRWLPRWKTFNKVINAARDQIPRNSRYPNSKKDMRNRYGSDSELRQKEQYRCMIIGARTRSLSVLCCADSTRPFRSSEWSRMQRFTPEWRCNHSPT